MLENLTPTPRPLEHEPLADVTQRVLKHFEDWTDDHKGAFLSNFLLTDEPSHINAYRLCALAERFPSQFLVNGEVIKSDEVTLSHNEHVQGYTPEALELRDILLFFVKANRNRLITRAAAKLGLHP